jgi:uncharacterized protein
MRSICSTMVFVTVLTLASMTVGIRGVPPQSLMAQNAAAKKVIGYDVKKPVFGGACPTCPWGSIADVVKEALRGSGWDVQICYYCAGGPTEARMVAGALVPKPPANSTEPLLPTPKGPVDFGATSMDFLREAYLGMGDFEKDPEGPRKQLRTIALIQQPTYYIVAAKANLDIKDLGDIVKKRLPVKIVAWPRGPRNITAQILDYYKISKETIESFGGSFTNEYSRDADVDVMFGFGSLVMAPEYNVWGHATQKYDFKYLELAPDLRAKLIQQYSLREGNMPLGVFRGVDKPVPTMTELGTVIYGRTDMPDDFAYALAKALDEHQELLQWANGSLNYSYNWRTVWKTQDVPLHPGAARYYKQVGYMK